MEDSMVVDILESGRNESLAKKSPNGRYRVAAAQADLALADRDQILWVAELTRPNNPSVSNDGTVAVENWGAADSRELESAFFVIDRNGSALIEREYEANSLASGISKDGKLAWYTTAHADSGDGNKVFVYDLEERKRLLKAELPLRGVEKVEAEGDLVRVYIDGLECEYREGELIDSEGIRWKKEERRIENAKSPGNLAGVMKNRLERSDELSIDQLHSTISTIEAHSFGLSGSDRSWARLYRRKGEIHQYLGQKEEALNCYEEALSLDENVGVKRKKRRLGEELREEEGHE
jgi:tetratricopeptide (TPR) repeat protein